MKRLLLEVIRFAAPLVVVAVWLWGYGSPGTAGRTPVPARVQPEDRSVDLMPTLSALQAEVKELALARPLSPDRPGEPDAAPVEGEPNDESGSIAPSDAERANQEATRLQERLASEPVDPDWAKRAEDALAESMSDDALAGSVMVDNWCASTLCRSEFLADDPESRTELLRALPRLAPWPTDGFFHLDPEDDLRVITYLSREGYPLALNETQ